MDRYEKAPTVNRGTNQNKLHSHSSTPINLFLDHRPNARKYGEGYRDACPAHEGKSRSTLSIKEGDDGRVLLHCFAGCSALDVVHSLGLELSDLFERPPANMTPQEKRKIRQLAKQGQWKTALGFLPLEIAVLEIAAVQLANDEPLNEADHLRLELAGKRITSAKVVLCGS
jgi:hypothetical protein